MLHRSKAIWVDDSGQDLAEYGLLVSLIAILVIAALTALGQNINTLFMGIANAMTGVAGGGGS